MARYGPRGDRVDRYTTHEIEFIPQDGTRLVWVMDAYPSGHVRVATFGRLNMTSNARCGRRVA